MSDFFKKNKSVIIVIGIIAISAAAWFLFRDIPSNRGTADDVRTELDSAAAKQREAATTLKSVQSGIVDSERSVGQLESANNSAKTAAGNIESANNSIKNAIGNAQESNTKSTELIADSQRRISESIGILQAIRETKQDVKN